MVFFFFLNTCSAILRSISAGSDLDSRAGAVEDVQSKAASPGGVGSELREELHALRGFLAREGGRGEALGAKTRPGFGPEADGFFLLFFLNFTEKLNMGVCWSVGLLRAIDFWGLYRLRGLVWDCAWPMGSWHRACC